MVDSRCEMKLVVRREMTESNDGSKKVRTSDRRLAGRADRLARGHFQVVSSKAKNYACVQREERKTCLRDPDFPGMETKT